jgi:hypothetical protein
MGGYMVAVGVGSFFTPAPPRPDAPHLAAGIVPLVPMFFALRETFLSVREMDELQRRIHIEGLLLAMLGTIAIVLGGGLLQINAGVPPLFGLFWLWIPICVLYALGVFLGRRRYS